MASETISTPRTERRRCVHHWIVEPADGPTSRGRCKHCGEERRFSNSTETAIEEVMKNGQTPPALPHRWR